MRPPGNSLISLDVLENMAKLAVGRSGSCNQFVTTFCTDRALMGRLLQEPDRAFRVGNTRAGQAFRLGDDPTRGNPGCLPGAYRGKAKEHRFQRGNHGAGPS